MTTLRTSHVCYAEDSRRARLNDAAIVGKERLSARNRSCSSVLHVWLGWILRSRLGFEC